MYVLKECRPALSIGNTVVPKGSCNCMVYTWALKGLLYPYFGVSVCTITILGPFGVHGGHLFVWDGWLSSGHLTGLANCAAPLIGWLTWCVHVRVSTAALISLWNCGTPKVCRMIAVLGIGLCIHPLPTQQVLRHLPRSCSKYTSPCIYAKLLGIQGSDGESIGTTTSTVELPFERVPLSYLLREHL